MIMKDEEEKRKCTKSTRNKKFSIVKEILERIASRIPHIITRGMSYGYTHSR